ncbi:hypothetical protein H4R35_007615, partial [Dimargaris xerosporica]
RPAARHGCHDEPLPRAPASVRRRGAQPAQPRLFRQAGPIFGVPRWQPSAPHPGPQKGRRQPCLEGGRVHGHPLWRAQHDAALHRPGYRVQRQHWPVRHRLGPCHGTRQPARLVQAAPTRPVRRRGLSGADVYVC